LLIRVLFTLLIPALLALVQGCAGMKAYNGESDFSLVYFDQGEDPGKLYYEYGETGSNILPQRMLVDGQGRFFFLERYTNRVQCFSAGGDFEYGLELAARSLGYSEEEAGGLEINFVDMFWCPDSALGVLVVVGEPGSESAKWFVVKCDADGICQAHFELKESPQPLTKIEMAYCDAAGFVWLYQDAWLVFNSHGQYNSTVKAYGHFVDANGYLFSDARPVKVLDRDGKTQAELKGDEEHAPDLLSFVSAKGLAVSWKRGLEEKQTPTTLSYPNEIVMFKLNREDWSCDPVATVAVPATEYQYPHEQSDFANPVQVYMTNSTVISGDTLYILAYSSESYWVNKLEVKGLLR
jgi:hypothetical protein